MSRAHLLIAIIGASAMAPLAACGSSSSDSGSGAAEEIAACVDVYALGAIVPEGDDNFCLGPDGERTFLGVGEAECPDGSTIAYNDYAFWRPEDRKVVALFPGEGFSQDDIAAACEA
jgi:hypothetical protein